MYILYQFCESGIDNEDEKLGEFQTIEEAVKFVEGQCRTSHEVCPMACKPLEQFLRNIDPTDRRKRDEECVFFKIAKPDEYGRIYIANAYSEGFPPTVYFVKVR